MAPDTCWAASPLNVYGITELVAQNISLGDDSNLVSFQKSSNLLEKY